MNKPFLKWAGGKSKLVPFIQFHLPAEPRKRLIEPFAGSAALSLSLEFDAYLLNDTNRFNRPIPNLKTGKASFY